MAADLWMSCGLVEVPPPPGDYPGWGLPCIIPDGLPSGEYGSRRFWRRDPGPRMVHRQVLAEFLGLRYHDLEMPEHVHHRCEIKACCQIAHLAPMTRRAHVEEHHAMRRSAARGRQTPVEQSLF